MGSEQQVRACWCGHPTLEDFAPRYRVCRACGTLVSSSKFDPALYGDAYWLSRQAEVHGLPNFAERARLDLPERCVHWLRHLLARRLPPGRILEVGCAHSGYVALLGWAGFEALGTELDEGVAALARKTFGTRVLSGSLAGLDLKAGSFDVIVLNDVIEHLPDPIGFLRLCAGLLSRDGFLVIQTPEYKEHMSYAELQASKDIFLKHMDRMDEEHLFLFSRRSVGLLLSRLGLPALHFANPFYTYDMHLTASRSVLPLHSDSESDAALQRSPVARLVLALLDKAYESNDRLWAIKRLEERARSTGAAS